MNPRTVSRKNDPLNLIGCAVQFVRRHLVDDRWIYVCGFESGLYSTQFPDDPKIVTRSPPSLREDWMIESAIEFDDWDTFNEWRSQRPPSEF